MGEYHWRDDIYAVAGARSRSGNCQLMVPREKIDDLVWKASALFCDEMGIPVTERNIKEEVRDLEGDGAKTLWAIHQASRLYALLIDWFGSEQGIYENARCSWCDDDYMYFVTGDGYDIMSADLLGGTADGKASREFDEFAEREI